MRAGTYMGFIATFFYSKELPCAPQFTSSVIEVLLSSAGGPGSRLIPICPQLSEPQETVFTVLLSFQVHVMCYPCIAIGVWLFEALSIVSNPLPNYFLM